MAEQSRGLFQFEDGSSIWFAVHERVTNRDIVVDLIKGQNGHIVENITDADFCLLSSCRRETPEVASLVTAEGGIAVESSWIWESAKLEKLLPWYQYHLGGHGYGEEKDDRTDLEDEVRDLHELSICLARHLPIVGSVENIYKHLSMKFPHRTSHKFQELHEENKEAVDSCVLHLAKQIDALYPPSGFFTRHGPVSTDPHAHSRTHSHSRSYSQPYTPIEDQRQGRGHQDHDGIPLTPASGSDTYIRRQSQDNYSRSRNASISSNQLRSLDDGNGPHQGADEAISEHTKQLLARPQGQGIQDNHANYPPPREEMPSNRSRHPSPTSNAVRALHATNMAKPGKDGGTLNNSASSRREYFNSLKNLYDQHSHNNHRGQPSDTQPPPSVPGPNPNISADSVNPHLYHNPARHRHSVSAESDSIIVTRLSPRGVVQETSARREQPDPLHSSNSFQRLSDSVMHASFGGGHNNNSRNHPHTSSQPFLPKPHSKSLDLYSTPNAYSPRNPVLPGMLKRKYRDASQPQLGKTPSESRIVLAANSAAAGPYPGDHRAPRASLGSQSSYAPHNSRVPVVSDTARVSDAYHSQSNKTTTSSDVAGSFASQFPRTAAVGIGAHMSTANVTNVNNRHNSTFDGDGRPNSNENHGNENEDDKEDDHLEKDDDTDASIESDDPLDDDYRNFWPGANNGNSHGTSGAGASAGNGTKLPASAQPNARFGHLGRGRKGRKRDPAKPPGTDNPKVPKKRVTQDQIDIIIQWILDHPFDEFPSQKFYWEDFATKCPIGPQRTAPSWSNIYQRHIKPHHAAAAVTRLQQQTGTTALNNTDTATAADITGNPERGEGDDIETDSHPVQSKKSHFDFGSVGAAETPTITPAGVSEEELTIMVDYLLNHPLQGANLQEYWKKFSEAMASFVQRSPHDWAVIYARRRRMLDEKVQLLKESVAKLPESSAISVPNQTAPVSDIPVPSDSVSSLNQSNSPNPHLVIPTSALPSASPMGSTSAPITLPIPAPPTVSDPTTRTRSFSEENGHRSGVDKNTEDNPDVDMVDMASPIQHDGHDHTPGRKDVAILDVQEEVSSREGNSHSATPDPEPTVTTFSDIEPFNLAGLGPYSEEILDMAQALYVEQCSTIPGADLSSLSTWTTFIKIHPTVLQDQSFWATRYQSRTKKIGEFVYGADAPRSPVLATRKIPSDKDKSQRSSTTDSSKSQIPRSLQQNQSQAGTTTSSASLDNTSINIAAYGPTDPNKASNSAGSPSRPNLLTGIKLTPSQLSKTPTPVSATSAKSLITVFASDASTRSMSMSISGQPSPNHASPTQFRNPGQLPYTVEYTPPSLSGQDQMLSPYVHPYSIMADQKSKEKYGFASLPSRYALTLEDKLAMARFVHMRPRGESESLTKWWETFIEYYKEGGHKRNALAWGSRYVHHEVEIRTMIAEIANEEAGPSAEKDGSDTPMAPV